jgi:death on curing protein
MTDYVTVVEALAIHADQIERYGGSPDLRDQGLLEAALFRPQTGYYPSLIEEAAALWESLSQNHPFVDGNKRTAFAITYTFLAINGAHLAASASESEEFLLNLYATGTFDFARLSRWLRENVAYDPSE